MRVNLIFVKLQSVAINHADVIKIIYTIIENRLAIIIASNLYRGYFILE